MKLIINTTNLQSGGALQVALSLLEEWNIMDKENEFHIFLSPQLELVIDKKNFKENFIFYSFDKNPTSTIFNPITFYKQLKTIEANIKPNAVFSIFGPALWKPKSPHLIGFANGYYLRDDSFFIREKVLNNFLRRLKYYPRRYVLFHQLKKEANHLWVETNLAKEKLLTTLNITTEKISVIGNTYGQNFEKEHPKFTESKTFTLLYLSTYYVHKNLEIIPQIISVLAQKNIDCSFMLTLPKSRFEEVFAENKNSKYLNNIGPINPQETHKIYPQANAAFMPSLLETFSANYPEAMKMDLPIVCSDFDFSRDICGDAALYFDAQNPQEIADKIIELITNKELQQQLIAAGKKRLEKLETPESRAKKLLVLLKEIAQTKNSKQ